MKRVAVGGGLQKAFTSEPETAGKANDLHKVNGTARWEEVNDCRCSMSSST